MDWQLLVGAVGALTAAVVIGRYVAWSSFRVDKSMRGMLGAALSAWIVRYSLSVTAAATGWAWIGFASNHTVIMVANLGIGFAAIAAIPDLKEVAR